MRRVLIMAAAGGMLLLSGCPDKKGSDAPRPHIVSLSPALTGILFEMGLGEHVVGVTQYCALPDGRKRPVVGDAFKINIEALLAVDPDLTLVQGLGTAERERTFQACREIKPGFRSESFAMTTLADLRGAIRRIGELAGRPGLAAETLKRFDGKLARVRQRVASLGRPRVLFISDYKRPLVAGAGNFTHDLIEIAGGTNCGAEIRGPRPWRRAGLEAILSARPDVLICLASPGEESAAKKHWLALNDLPAAREGRVFVVTDRRWTIPSTHVADLAAELAEMIHPQAAGEGSP